MKRTQLIEKILLSILIILIIISIPQFILTGKTIKQVPNQYSYTKAICDKSNYCKDYIIECKGNNLIKLNPTGFVIQQSQDWVDGRENRELCD